MKDFLLNEIDYDMNVTNYDFSLTSDLSEYVAQKLRLKLSFFKGEWYLNTLTGLILILII
jgi:hypothetical protein